MEGKTPREGWAALVLRHYHRRRAGVAGIRQTWLPFTRVRQPDGRYARWRRLPAGGAERGVDGLGCADDLADQLAPQRDGHPHHG
jgi:hypothetical protein